MKALKGILIYTGLILLAIILMFGLVVGIMFLRPKVNIFGYYFRNVSLKSCSHYSELTNSKEGSFGQTHVRLKIKAENYNIVVQPQTDDSNITIRSESDYFGFLKASIDADTNKKTAVDVPYLVYKTSDTVYDNVYTKTIEGTLTEPEGAFSYRDKNTLYLRLPFYDSHSKPIKYSFDLTTGNKRIEFKSGTEVDDKTIPINVGELTLSNKRGEVVIGSFGSAMGKIDKEITVTKLDVSTNGGIYDFTKFDKITVTDNILKLNSKNATYKFKNLVAEEGMEVVGDTVKLSAEKIDCGDKGFLYRADTGALNIGILNSSNRERTITTLEGKTTFEYVRPESETADKIYENTIFTDSAAVEIDEMVGKLGLSNKYGVVKIKHLSHQASITSENGDVIIGETGFWPTDKKIVINEELGTTEQVREFTETSSLIVYTTYGDIKVGSYYQDGVFYSKKGSIDVVSKLRSDNIADAIKGDRYYYTSITSKDGKITAVSDGNPIRIVCTGNANVKLTMKKLFETISYGDENNTGLLPSVFSENIPYYVSTNNGTITAKLPIQSYLVYVSGKISGEIGATSSFDAENGTQINAKKDNQPVVKITGKKIVLSSNI